MDEVYTFVEKRLLRLPRHLHIPCHPLLLGFDVYRVFTWDVAQGILDTAR
jgi:hypothetical protein